MSNRLPIIQAAVVQLHAEIGKLNEKAAVRALAAGDLLMEAKANCAHGEWGEWLAGTGLSERTAQRYMRLVRGGIKPAMLAEIGFARAERYIAAGVRLLPGDGLAGSAAGRDDEDERFGSVAYWWPEGEGTYRYFSHMVTPFGSEEISPKAPIPIWLLGLLEERPWEAAVDMVPISDAQSAVRELGGVV
jgi:hypothetical protein